MSRRNVRQRIAPFPPTHPSGCEPPPPTHTHHHWHPISSRGARCECYPGWLGFDCDEFFLSASVANGRTNERGGAAGFSLALARRPLGVVTCALAVTDASEGSVPPAVEIAPDSWRAAEVGHGSLAFNLK